MGCMIRKLISMSPVNLNLQSSVFFSELVWLIMENKVTFEDIFIKIIYSWIIRNLIFMKAYFPNKNNTKIN